MLGAAVLVWALFGALSEAAALRIGRQLGAALAHMHSKRILHRDLKPENVMLTESLEAKVAGVPPQYLLQ